MVSSLRCLRIFLLVSLLGTAAWFRPAQALSVAEWTATIARPSLAGAGIDAGSLQLAWGHLKLSSTGGRAYPVKAGDRLIGLFLTGPLEFRYTSADPLEHLVMLTNMKRNGLNTDLPPGELTEKVTAALVFLSAGVEALSTEPGWREGAPPREAETLFQQHLERFANDQGFRAISLLPQALVEPNLKSVVAAADIAGEDEDYQWMLDPLRTADEWIAVLKKLKNPSFLFKDMRFPRLISRQPLGRSRLEPRPLRFKLIRVDVAVNNPADMMVDVESTLTFVAASPLRTLELELLNTRYGESGAFGSAGKQDYTLHAVTTENGQPLSYVHNRNEVVVELPRVLAPDERITLKFHTSGNILYHPGNDNYWELGTFPWLPLPGRLEQCSFSYHAICRVPSVYLAFSNGQTVRRWEENGQACAEFKEDQAIQLPVVLAGKYAVQTFEFNGLTVHVGAYAMSKKGSGENLAKMAVAFLDFLHPFLGPFPFKELKILEINDYGFGQAPGGILFITKEAFIPMKDALTRLTSEGVNERIVHEIVHSWWGNQAQLGAPEDSWLSESVTDYVAAWAMGKMKKESEFNTALDHWKSEAKLTRDKGTVLLAEQLSGDAGREDRQRLLYNRGPLALQALRAELGDDAFFTVLKSYLRSFPFKPAETRLFIKVCEVVAKRSIAEWFNQYILGNGWPEVK